VAQLESLSKAEAARAHPDLVNREYGIVFLKLGRSDKARPYLAKAAAADPRASFYRGLVAVEDGDIAAAEKEFAVAARFPYYARKAAAFSEPLKRARTSEAIAAGLKELAAVETGAGRALAGLQGAGLQGRPDGQWEFSLDASLNHNSNVVGVPDDLPLPADAGRKKDTEYILDLGAKYSFLLADSGWAGSVFLNAYCGEHAEIHETDYERLTPGVQVESRFDDWYVRIAAYYSHDWLQNNTYRRGFTLSPSATVSHGPAWQSTLALATSHNDFAQAPADDSEERTGVYHDLSYRITRDCGELGHWSLTAHASTQNTDGSSYDGQGYGAGLYGFVPILETLSASVNLRYDILDFDHQNFRSANGRARKDGVLRAGCRLAHQFTDDLELYAAFRYTNNDSNIEESFEYDQELYTLGLRWLFRK